MARPMTTTAVGRVNRRFLFLALILAVLSAVLVYAAVTKSGGDGGSSAADFPVLVATQDIVAGSEITAGMLGTSDFAEDQVPSGALASPDQAIGRIAKETIVVNEPVLASSVVDTSIAVDGNILSYIVKAQQRGMAIKAVQVVGAGGLVLPGDHVDVYWIPTSPREDVEGAVLLAENVEVLAVQQAVLDIAPTAPGVTEEDPENPAPAGTGDRIRSGVEEQVPDAITITLMLSPRQSSNVFCGDEGGILRLAVRSFGDNSPNGQPVGTCIILGTEELP